MRHLLHKAIVWYLRRCGSAFHCFEYGPQGRYVVLMNEQQYHDYTTASHKDWCMRMAELEDDSEVGAGLLAIDPVPDNEIAADHMEEQ